MLERALDENRKLQRELRSTLEAHTQRLAAVQAFADQWRFVAPLLPLGRVNLLPKLLSLETVRGQRVAVGAASQWKALDLMLAARTAEYQAALAARRP
ncbi:MAG: hypothetical protein M3Y59_16970 [Myxococcota bacterium]|nr:hypothetical protein [Myxococcota bacterium]